MDDFGEMKCECVQLLAQTGEKDFSVLEREFEILDEFLRVQNLRREEEARLINLIERKTVCP